MVNVVIGEGSDEAFEMMLVLFGKKSYCSTFTSLLPADKAVAGGTKRCCCCFVASAVGDFLRCTLRVSWVPGAVGGGGITTAG